MLGIPNPLGRPIGGAAALLMPMLLQVETTIEALRLEDPWRQPR